MKLVIWDFHGVMEKDNEKAVKDISNKVLEEFGFSERLCDGKTSEFYGLKWYQYFERLLPHESIETHYILQDACQEYGINNLDKIAKHIKPNDYIHEVLENTAKKGYEQIVISNTSPEHLDWFVTQVGVKPYFRNDQIIGVNGHRKKAMSKIEALQQFLEKNPKNSMVSIGDSIGDINLGKHYGAKTVLYCHPGREFPDCDADHKIRTLKEIDYLI